MKRLSVRQQKILGYIRAFLGDHQYPPTVRDIQGGCDISSTSVVDYNLRILQREGHIRRYPDVSRGIEIMDGGKRAAPAKVVAVPVLGYIAAGQPLPILSSDSWRVEALETQEIPAALIKGKKNVYALRVKGQSMIDALIDDGDLVVMESTPQVENGEMVAAWLKDEHEATLKKFYLEGEKVRLQPANSAMDPIIVPAEDVEIHGRVIAVLRGL